MNHTPTRLFLTPALWQAMLEHSLACLPEEACGLLGGLLAEDGRSARVARALLIENALHSPVRFRMAPEEQLKAFLALETDGLELVAFFHSHPKGPSHPSPTDLGEFAYPGVLSLILSPSANGGWQLRAFAIHGVYDTSAAYNEVAVEGLGP